MLELKTKKQLSIEAHKLAQGLELVRYRSVTYIPADYETRETGVTPSPDRAIWLPLRREQVRLLAAHQYDSLFGSDGELAGFDFMVAQSSRQVQDTAPEILIRSVTGLLTLKQNGSFADPSGEFIPNTVRPMLNEDPAIKEEVFNRVSEWLDSEEEAHSILRHLATCLAPGWSAVKYVLFLGDGRNGKSLLLKMVQALFGIENVAHVSRQHIAEQSPVVTELNGKLVNIIFDGRAEYLKDSGSEKSLIAGEEIAIRKLYESTPTIVQTNALFIEGLQKEPKSSDKSTALQRRLVRFQFPNVYELNHGFERLMLSEARLGAFLSLLIDHYVVEDAVATMLAPTTKAVELQLEHMYINSIGLQYLKYVVETDLLGIQGILEIPIGELVQRFQSWRIKENDLGTWAEPDVQSLFIPLINTERRSVRINGDPRKVRVVTSLKPEALAFVESLKGDHEDEAHSELLVGD